MPSFTIIAIKKALFWKPREKNLYRQVQFAKTRASTHVSLKGPSLSMSSFAISDHWSRGWALLASVGLDTRILFLLFVHLLEEQHTSWQLASSVFSSVKVLKYIK